MLRFVLALFCIVVAVDSNGRIGQLPVRVWQKMRALPPYQGKIVGGQEVERHSIPHQISFQGKWLDFTFHFCGGSIMNQNTVITAAHCCAGQKVEEVQILAGAHNLEKEEEEEEEKKKQTRDVASIIMHDDYDASTFENDICLLKLAKSLNYTDAVAPVEMPSQGENFTGEAEVSGWGTLEEDGSSPDVLYSVNVTIVSDRECRNAYGEYDIADSMICAGGGGHDSCQGDSGGPMTCGDEKKHCGIVSWGIGCARPTYPGVYTETSSFVDWIGEQLFSTIY